LRVVITVRNASAPTAPRVSSDITTVTLIAAVAWA
jgi:hypothetical protein